eukprot:32357-Eustigmatos_ZCMA.PRE.1
MPETRGQAHTGCNAMLLSLRTQDVQCADECTAAGVRHGPGPSHGVLAPRELGEHRHVSTCQPL